MFDCTSLLNALTSFEEKTLARIQKWSTVSPAASGGMHHLTMAAAGGVSWSESAKLDCPAPRLPRFRVWILPSLSVIGSHVPPPEVILVYSNCTVTLSAV